MNVQRRFLDQAVRHRDHGLAYDAGQKVIKNLSTGAKTPASKDLQDFMAGTRGEGITVTVNPQTLRLERV